MGTHFTGKTALISGGASGIGLALAQELGEQGMQVVIADIDEAELQNAEHLLVQQGVNVLACVLDVTDFTQWQNTVEQAIARFGKLHMLINNAGVGGVPGRIEDTDHATWRWVVDVNMMGVLYGTQASNAALKAHGEGAWIINVASMAGMMGVPYSAAYAATKAAVVSMSESWAVEFKPFNIHVSVLCPAFVQTRIHESVRHQQDKYRSLAKVDKAQLEKSHDAVAALVEAGIPPRLLAKRVIEGLTNKQSYIFTHPNYRPATTYRAKAVDMAFDDAQNSELVSYLMNEEMANM